MIQVPQGVEDLTVHVELNESSAGVNVDLELYDAGPDKFLVSHRDGIVNDEQTEGQQPDKCRGGSRGGRLLVGHVCTCESHNRRRPPKTEKVEKAPTD